MGLERSRTETGSDFYYAIISGRYSQPPPSIDRSIESFASNSFPPPSYSPLKNPTVRLPTCHYALSCDSRITGAAPSISDSRHCNLHFVKGRERGRGSKAEHFNLHRVNCRGRRAGWILHGGMIRDSKKSNKLSQTLHGAYLIKNSKTTYTYLCDGAFH